MIFFQEIRLEKCESRLYTVSSLKEVNGTKISLKILFENIRKRKSVLFTWSFQYGKYFNDEFANLVKKEKNEMRSTSQQENDQ